MHLTVKQFCVYFRYIKKFEAYAQLRAFDSAIYADVKPHERKNILQKYLNVLEIPTIISKPKDVESSWQLLREKAWQSKDQI